MKKCMSGCIVSLLLISSLFLFSPLPIPANPFMVDTTIIYDETSNWQSNSAVAFDGTNFLVVWQDLRKDGYSHIRGCRVHQNGQILDEGGFTISLTEPYTYTPDVSFNGTYYIVVWRGENRISGRAPIIGVRIDTSGSVIDTFPINISDPYPGTSWILNPIIRSSNSNSLIVWTVCKNTFSIKGARLSSQGVLLDSVPIDISVNTVRARHPSIAFDGTNYLVVWEDYRSYQPDSINKYIRGRRVSLNGIVIDSIPFEFVKINSPWPYSNELMKLNPSLEFCSGIYLLTWNFRNINGDSTQDIFGIRVDPDCSVLDTNPLLISSANGNQNNSAVSSDGLEFLVAWMDFRWNPDGNEPTVYFSKVDTSGNVLNPFGTPLLMSTQQRNPSVCYGDGEFLVSFRDRRGNPFMYAYDDDIFVARIDNTGNPLDPQGISTSLSTQDQRMPAVGFDGENHLVVWEDQRNDDTDLYGAIIDSTGNMISPPGIFVISDEVQDQLVPAVDFIDPYYFVVWVDFRNDTSFPEYYSTRITKDGTILDPTGIKFDINLNNYFPRLPHATISNDSINFLVGFAAYSDNWPHRKGIFYRIDTSGTILDSAGIEIDSCTIPDISFDGQNWMICYLHPSNKINGIRLSSEGNLLFPAFRICQQPYIGTSSLSIAYNGTYYIVCWENLDVSSHDIYASRVSPAGYDIDTVDILISSKPNDQYDIKTACVNENYFIVWTDTRFDTLHDYIKQIYGAYVSPDGIVMDTNGIELTPPFSEDKFSTLVKSAGNKYLLCYSGFTEFPYGSYRIHGQFIDALTGVDESEKEKLFVNKLEKNFPNPFTRSTEICYHIKHSGKVDLSVYNAAGRLVKRLVNDNKNPGVYTAQWDGKDSNAKRVSNGVYFYKLSAIKYTQTMKMVLVR